VIDFFLTAGDAELSAEDIEISFCFFEFHKNRHINSEKNQVSKAQEALKILQTRGFLYLKVET